MTQLAPSPKFTATYVDADGFTKPAEGYKLWAYAAGTSTPKDTYTDSTLGSANTNPVVLNVRGEADVWMSGNYKFVFTDPADATIWTVDNINDLGSGASLAGVTLTGALTITSTAVTWSGNPTHSGNHTFSGNVVINGNATLGDAGADTVTVNASTLTWPNTPTHSGAHTWSGTQTFSVEPAGKIVSGTYAPTYALTTNVSAATGVSAFNYLRIGGIVYVTGSTNITPTGAGAVEVRISLPFAATFAGGEVSGVGSDIGTHGSGLLSASVANTAAFKFTAASGTISGFGFAFSYRGA